MTLLDRLPLPRLETYTALSLVLFASALFHAQQVTVRVLEEQLDAYEEAKNASNTSIISDESFNSDSLVPNNASVTIITFLGVMVDEPWCTWTLINMAYCCLVLLGKGIQKMVFGDLRVSEQQHIKDKFWNFVFYKFIFIFGVMNVQYIDEIIMWCAWFSLLGFKHILVQLCKDRFEYLSFSPSTPRVTHVRLLILLSSILVVSVGLLVVCCFVGLHAGLNTFAFMAAECFLLTIRTLYVIVRYAIHLWDLNNEGVWENRGSYIYYTELIFELAALSVDFGHHVHMLMWGNIFLSMASLVICMQLRYLFHEMQRRIKKHKNYLHVVHHMETNYPMATPDELARNNDDCAICWDKMESARILPCAHMFHNSCLRSWLEQDTSCPTCRTALSDSRSSVAEHPANNNVPETPTETPNRPHRNHFFHFDGSRYVSWLPSFSVEVTHTQLLGEPEQQTLQTSQLDSMARQVQSMFSHMPINIIQEDLRRTHSVELTIENILDERLIPPPSVQLSHSARQSSLPPSSLFSDTPVSSAESPSSNFHGEIDELYFSDADDSEAHQNSEELHCEVTGSRFSKSPLERESMLQKRKELLLKQARKKYTEKHRSQVRSESESSTQSSDQPVDSDAAASRRNLMFQAAQRRLQENSQS